MNLFLNTGEHQKYSSVVKSNALSTLELKVGLLNVSEYGEVSGCCDITCSGVAETPYAVCENSLVVGQEDTYGAGTGVTVFGDCRVTGSYYVGSTKLTDPIALDVMHKLPEPIRSLSVKSNTNLGNTVVVDSLKKCFGINTSEPAYTVDVVGDVNLTEESMFSISGSNCLSESSLGTSVLYSSLRSVGDLSELVVSGVTTLDTPTLVINTRTHRVGMGTNIPAQMLHVVGNLNVDSNSYYTCGKTTVETSTSDGVTTTTSGIHVLSGSELGTGVTASHLTSLGTLTSSTYVSGDVCVTGLLVSGGRNLLDVIDQNTELVKDVVVTESVTCADGALYVGSGYVGFGGPVSTSNGYVCVAGNLSATEYHIGESSTLTRTQLGTSVTDSSLTKLGTLPELVVQGKSNLNLLIAQSSHVGIGVLDPSYSVNVVGSTNSSLGYTYNSEKLLYSSKLGSSVTSSSLTSIGTLSSLQVDGNLLVGTSTLSVSPSTNYVGIGTVLPQYPMDVVGDIRLVDGNVRMGGSIRLNASCLCVNNFYGDLCGINLGSQFNYSIGDTTVLSRTYLGSSVTSAVGLNKIGTLAQRLEVKVKPSLTSSTTDAVKAYVTNLPSSSSCAQVTLGANYATKSCAQARYYRLVNNGVLEGGRLGFAFVGNTANVLYLDYKNSTSYVGINTGVFGPPHTLTVGGITNLDYGGSFLISDTPVLSEDTLGSSVTTSILTSVGSLSSLSLNGPFVLASSGTTARSVGQLGYVKQALLASDVLISTSGAVQNVVSLPLDVGVWDVRGYVTLSNNSGTTSLTRVVLGLRDKPDTLLSSVDTSLLLQYTFRDVSGQTLQNLVTSTYDATVHNGATVGQPDRTGTLCAISTDATSQQYVSLPTTNLDSGGCSFTFWFRSTSTGYDSSTIFDVSGISVQVYNGNLVLNLAQSSVLVYTSNVNDSVWRHFALVLTPEGHYFTYINGTCTYSDETTNSYPVVGSYTTNYLFQSTTGNNTYFSGSISDFRYYSRYLSVADIAKLLGVTDPFLQFHYTFDNVVNSTSLYNESFGVYDAVLCGGASVTNSQKVQGTSALLLTKSLTNELKQYVQLPSVTLPTGGFTISLWFRGVDLNTWAHLFYLGTDSLEDTVQLYHTNNQLFLQFKVGLDATFNVPVVSNHVNTNTWQHLAVVVTASGYVYAYVNGLESYSNTTGNFYPTPGTKSVCYIGKSPSTYQWSWGGGVDNFKFYTRALSAGEVTRLLGDRDPYFQLHYTFEDLQGNYLLNGAYGTYDALLCSGASTSTSSKVHGTSALTVNKDLQQYVQLPPITVTSNGCTFACWFRSDGNSDYARIFDVGNGSSAYNIILNITTSKLVLTVSDIVGTGTYSTTVVSTSVNDNVWRHVAITFNVDGTHFVYLNGAVVFTGSTLVYPPVGTRSSNYLCRSNWSTDPYFSGGVDDFRYYTRSLTASEVTSLLGFSDPYFHLQYKFEDVQGNYCLNSVYGTYDALLCNGASTSTSTNVQGTSALVVNKELQQYVQLPPVNITSNGCTFACWFRSDSNAQNARVFDIGTGSSSYNVILEVRPTQLVLTVLNVPIVGTYSVAVVSTSVNDNVWRHVAIVFNTDGTHFVYINGSLVFTGSKPIYPPTGVRTSNYLCKSNMSSDPYYSGGIDDFRYYARSLTASEVTSLQSSQDSGGERNPYTYLLGGRDPYFQLQYTFEDVKDNYCLNDVYGTYGALLCNGASTVTSSKVQGMSALSVNKDLQQYVQLPPIYITSNGLTLACWFRSNGSANYARVFDFGYNGVNYNVILYVYASQLKLTVRNVPVIGVYDVVVSTTSVNDNTWRHVAIVFNADGKHFVYLNGTLVFTSSVLIYPPVGVRNTNYLCRSNWSTDPYFSGGIDDFRYYARSLTANEVTNLLGDRDPYLYLYYTFETFYNSLCYNSAYGVYDATLRNGAVADRTTYAKGNRSINLTGTLMSNVLLPSVPVTSSGLTIALWFRSYSPTGSTLFTLSNGVPDTVAISIVSNYLKLLVKRGTYTIVNQVQLWGTSVNDRVWRHLAVVFNSSGYWYAYVNGTLTSSYETSNVYPTVGPRTSNFLGAGVGFNGNIDDVRYYGRSLSSQDVQTLYQSTGGSDSTSTSTSSVTINSPIVSTKTLRVGSIISGASSTQWSDSVSTVTTVVSPTTVYLNASTTYSSSSTIPTFVAAGNTGITATRIA